MLANKGKELLDEFSEKKKARISSPFLTKRRLTITQ